MQAEPERAIKQNGAGQNNNGKDEIRQSNKYQELGPQDEIKNKQDEEDKQAQKVEAGPETKSKER